MTHLAWGGMPYCGVVPVPPCSVTISTATEEIDCARCRAAAEDEDRRLARRRAWGIDAAGDPERVLFDRGAGA